MGPYWQCKELIVLLSTVCKVKIYACTIQNNYYNSIYLLDCGCLFFLNFQSAQCDSRGVLGWEAVDALAAYLVGLNRTITALSSQEEADIVQLYMALHAMDKVPSKYSQRVKKKTLPGLWRASRKRSGSAPGQQAAER